jgi:hypothetical protein
MRLLSFCGAVGAVIALLGGGSRCQAAMIQGSLPLAGFVVTQNGGNLGSSTVVSAALTLTSSTGTQDYAPIPIATNFGPNTVDVNNLTAFTLSNATFGTFTTTSGVILLHNTSFLNVFLVGVYSPGPGLAAGLTPGPTSARISINQSGASLSEAITLSSPPEDLMVTPEPTSVVLAGIGLSCLGAFTFRRRSQPHLAA